MKKKKQQPARRTPSTKAPVESPPGNSISENKLSRKSDTSLPEWAGLVVLPLVAFWVMRFVPINQNMMIDPYVYTGYIHAFRELIARYGVTYYGVRFALIVPSQWFAHWFGPEGGYFTLRYVLALVAAVPMYFMTKRHFSQPVALLGAIGLLTSPYFARALLWDYPDATGVPFLSAAICLFLLDEPPALCRDTFAGACAAMAVHSNFFTIALVGIFGGVWLFVSLLFRHSMRQLFTRIGSVTVGSLVVTVLGCVYYWHALHRPTDIFSVTLGVASALAKGGTAQWRTSGTAWIGMNIHVLVPVFLAFCCLLVTRWRTVSYTSAIIVIFGIVVTAFYYVEQFFLNSDILQLFYYFSYIIPAIFLMLAFLWQSLWERIKRAATAFVALGLAALFAQWKLPARSGWALWDAHLAHWLLTCGAAAVIVFLATRKMRWPRIEAILPWIALAALSGCFSGGLEDYRSVVRAGESTAKREMEVHRVALQFLDAVPKVSEHPGIIRFWYNNQPGNAISSVQSTYLWGYSRLQASPPADPGLPYVNESHLRVLNDPQLRYLGLLCETEEELSQGLAALRQEAVEFKNVDHRVLASGDYRIYFQLVELNHGF